MALKVASTGPSPVAVALTVSPSISSSSSAFCGPLEPATTISETKRMRSLVLPMLSSTSATMSSSKTSFFLSARSLKRRKASSSALSPSS